MQEIFKNKYKCGKKTTKKGEQLSSPKLISREGVLIISHFLFDIPVINVQNTPSHFVAFPE